MRNFFGVPKLVFVAFNGFLKILDPSTLGGHNFFHSNMFLMIFSALNASIGGIQVLFGHQKQQNTPLGSSLP